MRPDPGPGSPADLGSGTQKKRPYLQYSPADKTVIVHYPGQKIFSEVFELRPIPIELVMSSGPNTELVLPCSSSIFGP